MGSSHLHFHEVDVWREAESDFSVVCVVFAVPNVDGYVHLVAFGLDEHSESERPAGQAPCNAHLSPPEGRRALACADG